MRHPSETRLATYGTLSPGRPNHHHLAGLSGEWRSGLVRGRLLAEGWGADLGFPGLALDPQGPEVAVAVFESADLPEHWPRLDAFEGEGYRRVKVLVRIGKDEIETCIYVLASTEV